jgi:hypothetical protein
MLSKLYLNTLSPSSNVDFDGLHKLAESIDRDVYNITALSQSLVDTVTKASTPTESTLSHLYSMPEYIEPKEYGRNVMSDFGPSMDDVVSGIVNDFAPKTESVDRPQSIPQPPLPSVPSRNTPQTPVRGNESNQNINSRSSRVNSFSNNKFVPRKRIEVSNSISKALNTVASIYLNRPYKWGASVNDKTCSDCSSLSWNYLTQLGYKGVPRVSYDQYLYFKKKGRIKPFSRGVKQGDVLFLRFGKKRPVDHVMIVDRVSGDNVYVLESSSSIGKTVRRRLPPHYPKFIVGVGEV